jgi:hypothetical protein
MLRYVLPLLLLAAPLLAAGPAATPTPAPRKIKPGEVIVPTENMRRIWGELVSIDLQTRTGTFRNESTDEIMPFTVLPYAELYHHAAFGDLQDFRTGERAIFRLHENDQGEWRWLTYIQDEMNMMNNHKEYFHVDRLDPAAGEIEATQGSADKSYIREKGIIIKTDGETRYWKKGQPAKFAELKLGDQIRTRTHGTGKGKTRVAWEVFLDDESLQKFQAEQKVVEQKRLTAEGAPGYVDAVNGQTVELTMFWESGEMVRKWKAGDGVKIAPAGADRKASAPAVSGAVASVQPAGQLTKLTLTVEEAKALRVKDVARVWGGK